MPFSRPTLTQLKAQASADLPADILRFSNLGVLAQVIAGAVYGNYGFLDYIALQAVPFTATGEFLEGWAALKGVVREAATAALGPVAFTGVNGLQIPAGTNVVRGDGRTYVTQVTETVASGTVTVTVQDTTPGAAGNTGSGAVMTLGTAIAGIQSGGLTTANLTGGADVETDASLRSRMLQTYAAPPQGGDLADYVTWALQVPGVTRAWNAGVALGAGTVQVFFMMDVTEAAYGGFPQGTNGVAALETRATAATGDQLAVANHIYPLRPVTALVYAYAPTANPVSFTITGTSAWSAATKAAVQAAIALVLLQQAAPGGVTDFSGNPIGIVDLSYIEAAIAAIAGTAGFVITVVSCTHGTITPGGDGNISSNAGYLATLGTVTFS